MNREDFLILDDNIVYFDNAATTLKPKCLIESLSDYYNKYPSNIGRGYYKISREAYRKYEECRDLTAKFLNADSKDEIIFTGGTTDGINRVVFGFFENVLNEGDEVLITLSEHASNVLPWFELKDKKGIVIKYIPLNSDYKITLENLKKVLTPKTKVISIAHITNVIGDIRPIKEICNLAREIGVFTLIDGAQSVPHMKIDLKDLDIDFLVFSTHKMLGPTGLGILYGKKHLLDKMKPIFFGGGMNLTFEESGNRTYLNLPQVHEAGTPNIASVIAFKDIINYLNNIGMDKIYDYEKMLREYALNKLSRLDNIVIYNKNSESGIITFNILGFSAKEVSKYLDMHNICIRTGQHCAKILGKILGVDSTCRISLYFYNTREEIDYLFLALKHIKKIT